jgi:hypothetical protein
MDAITRASMLYSREITRDHMRLQYKQYGGNVGDAQDITSLSFFVYNVLTIKHIQLQNDFDYKNTTIILKWS